MGGGASSDKYDTAPHTRERRGSSVLGGAGANAMVLQNLSDSTTFDKKDLHTMQRSFQELAALQGNPNTITEDEFREALSTCGILESDGYILHQLFGVMDKSNDGQVNFKDFITCASVMISGSIKDKLNFTFELYCGGASAVSEGDDDQPKTEVSASQMKDVLNHLNTTASWFGDPSLSTEEVEKLVKEVFERHDENKSGSLSYAQYMHAVAENPILVQFVNGKGTRPPTGKAIVLPVWWCTVKVGFKGGMMGKGEGWIKASKEFDDLVKSTRSERVVKSSVLKESLSRPGEFVLLQEWHGPIDEKLYKESAFWKICEGTEGVEVELETWKSVNF